MNRIFTLYLGLALLVFLMSGCQSKPQEITETSTYSIANESIESVEDIPSSDYAVESAEEALKTSEEASEFSKEQESQESEEEKEGFLGDIHEYLELLDGTFADLYAKDPELKLYFSYHYGTYAKNALLDFSIIKDEYPDINEWRSIQGEMIGPEPGTADGYYNFETGKYEMTDFPIKTIYISGDNLAELYGDSITKENMEQFLGVEILTTENGMTGALQGLPIEMEQYVVGIGFSMDNTVSSIGISKQQ